MQASTVLPDCSSNYPCFPCQLPLLEKENTTNCQKMVSVLWGNWAEEGGSGNEPRKVHGGHLLLYLRPQTMCTCPSAQQDSTVGMHPPPHLSKTRLKSNGFQKKHLDNNRKEPHTDQCNAEMLENSTPIQRKLQRKKYVQKHKSHVNKSHILGRKGLEVILAILRFL